jgi:hypothetical protein
LVEHKKNPTLQITQLWKIDLIKIKKTESVVYKGFISQAQTPYQKILFETRMNIHIQTTNNIRK